MSSKDTIKIENNIVSDEEFLWRRIHQSLIIWEADRPRPISGAFKRSSNKDAGVSVDIASKTTPDKSIKDSAALASVQAIVPRDLGYPVCADPIPDNPAHALIKGNISVSNGRKIAKKCTWVIPPKK
ncbi:MAG: hypothetical protein A2173_02635 [Planctomycetes bacterium RBG_13_44_8b]|nr:MAG: hypothetical protein A2173_02635 [Planctomycetes bacterium RBG_13_44_8b]